MRRANDVKQRVVNDSVLRKKIELCYIYWNISSSETRQCVSELSLNLGFPIIL